MAGQLIWASKEPMDEVVRCPTRDSAACLVALHAAPCSSSESSSDDSHAGGRILDPPCFSHTLPPAPPTPDLTAWNLPLSDRDVLRVAIVFLAVLVTAEKYVG